MGAFTNYYVDPAGGDDGTGDGSVGNPWAAVQHALDTITRDATNGDQINVKAGGTDTLAATLSLATYGTPTAAAPLVIRGYTTAANDGGVGMIGCGGANVALFAPVSFVHFIHMDLGDCGASQVIHLDAHGSVVGCRIHTTSGGGVRLGNYSQVIACHIENVGGFGINFSGIAGYAYGNFLETGANAFSTAINIAAQGGAAAFNVLKLAGASVGINVGQVGGIAVLNNSIFATAGTGKGVRDDGPGRDNYAILNNIIEGFSGAGGEGVNLIGSANMVGYNAFYNNTTDKSITGDVIVNLTAFDQALGASPFTNPAGNDFTVSTAVKALGYPASYLGASTNQFIDIGAAQREEPSGGGGRRPRGRYHGV